MSEFQGLIFLEFSEQKEDLLRPKEVVGGLVDEYLFGIIHLADFIILGLLFGWGFIGLLFFCFFGALDQKAIQGILRGWDFLFVWDFVSIKKGENKILNVDEASVYKIVHELSDLISRHPDEHDAIVDELIIEF